MMLWKSREVVLDEKLMFKKMYSSIDSPLNAAITVTVLEAPEDPQKSTGFLRETTLLSNQA
jgi:hypothetical protein